MSACEKAVGVLDTPATALKTTHPEFTPEKKRPATLQARCALAGVTLHEIENDRGQAIFIVSRWALTRELPDLEAVSRWLDAVTGAE